MKTPTIADLAVQEFNEASCTCPNPALHLELAQLDGNEFIDPKKCLLQSHRSNTMTTYTITGRIPNVSIGPVEIAKVEMPAEAVKHLVTAAIRAGYVGIEVRKNDEDQDN